MNWGVEGSMVFLARVVDGRGEVEVSKGTNGPKLSCHKERIEGGEGGWVWYCTSMMLGKWEVAMAGLKKYLIGFLMSHSCVQNVLIPVSVPSVVRRLVPRPSFLGVPERMVLLGRDSLATKGTLVGWRIEGMGVIGNMGVFLHDSIGSCVYDGR
jgi:hypothetical protein